MTIINLDEAVIEGEVVSDRVLPALPVGGVVGEGGHDPEVDVGKGQLPGTTGR